MSTQPSRVWAFPRAGFFFAARLGLALTLFAGLARMPALAQATPSPSPTHILYSDPARVQCAGSDPIVWVNIGVAYYLPGTPGYQARVGSGGFACRSTIIGLGLSYLDGSSSLTKDPWPATCAAGDPVVWGNKTSGAYYLPGTPGYNAKVGAGGYGCKSDLDRAKWLDGAHDLTKEPWPTACAPGDPVVWVNGGVAYYLPDSPGYKARVGRGGFICKSDIVRLGYIDGDAYTPTKDPWPAACAAGDSVVWAVFRSDWSDYTGVTYFLPDSPGYNAKVGVGGYMCKANLLRWFSNAVALTTIPTPRPSPTAGASGGNSWSATAVQFRGQNGSRHAYTCPRYGYAYPVIGTFSYSDVSSVCTAAVHAGLITFTHGGTVTIEIRPGNAEYVGLREHGVTSRSAGRGEGNFIFVSS